MQEYHKIQTVFKRDPATNMKTLLEGEFSEPEFAYLQNNEWIFTEKVDGTNIRVMIHSISAGSIVEFGGKTDNALIPAALATKLQWMFASDDPLYKKMFPDGACLYGEGYGARIQKGSGNYRPDPNFVLFDVKIGDWWLRRDAVEEIANEFAIDVVPTLGNGDLKSMVEMARTGFNSRWGNFTAEGIVARPAIELKTRAGQRIITKIKHKDFAS